MQAATTTTASIDDGAFVIQTIPLPGSAAAMKIEGMTNVRLTPKGLTMAKEMHVSEADINYNLFLALPNNNAPDQINFFGMTGGGFTCSRQQGGIIKSIES